MQIFNNFLIDSLTVSHYDINSTHPWSPYPPIIPAMTSIRKKIKVSNQEHKNYFKKIQICHHIIKE